MATSAAAMMIPASELGVAPEEMTPGTKLAP